MNLVTKQALLDEIVIEEELIKEVAKTKRRSDYINRAHFIGGLKRAAEMCDQPEFQPEPSYEELEERIKVAYEIISRFTDNIEKEDPKKYYSSIQIALCNDWFKWADNEMSDEDKEKYFNYPPKN